MHSPLFIAALLSAASAFAQDFKAGIGRADITPAERLWVAAYGNDVFACVPSMRILAEGGYEADFNLIYYGLPARFAPEVEETLVSKVIEMTGRTGDSK